MINFYEKIFNLVEPDLKDLPIFVENKNIFITGSTGFIGGYILNYLCWIKSKYSFDCKITLAIRSKSNLYKVLLPEYHKSSFLEILNIDLMDYKAISSLNNIESKFDLIFHAASPSSGKAYSNNKNGTMFINNLIVDSLFKTLKNKHSIFIYFSTSGIYGIHNDDQYPLKEETISKLDHLDSKNIYLISKLTGETILNTLGEVYEKRIIILRPSINYGPYLNPEDGRALSDFLVKALKKRVVTINSSGKSMRNYCFISDTLTGIFFALIRGKKYKIYNLAHDKETSIINLAEIISKKTNSKLEVLNQKGNHLGLDFNRTLISCEKLKSIGWNAKVSLEEGLDSTIKFFEEYLQSY